MNSAEDIATAVSAVRCPALPSFQLCSLLEPRLMTCGYAQIAYEENFDVVVVGGGPGGAIAAKRCAENGLSTLLVERKSLPRDKVCTGMIMGDWAHSIIRRDFGEIPETVLAEPKYLSGHQFHVSGEEPRILRALTPLTWRKDLDAWLISLAEGAGVSIRQGSRVTSVRAEQGFSIITAQRGRILEELRARYVVGADGSSSIVRRSLFPKLKVRYSVPIRECYQGELELDKKVIHWFFPKGKPRPRFNVNHKDGVFLIEGSGIRELRREIAETLAHYGFCPESKPEWKDACAIALLHEPLTSRGFSPAQGNILLIGDAAGLILPITYEGIGSALKSGILAADSIVRSAGTGKDAATSYLADIEPIIHTIRRLCEVQDELGKGSCAGSLAESLLDAYRETLVIQSRQE